MLYGYIINLLRQKLTREPDSVYPLNDEVMKRTIKEPFTNER